MIAVRQIGFEPIISNSTNPIIVIQFYANSIWWQWSTVSKAFCKSNEKKVHKGSTLTWSTPNIINEIFANLEEKFSI